MTLRGKFLYGPVRTNNVFRGFAGESAEVNNGDAVVRYDPLADRWLIVMPIFRRLPPKHDEPPIPKAGEAAHWSLPSVKNQPGPAEPLFHPPATSQSEAAGRRGRRAQRPAAAARGSYAMCYAISTSSDPLGSYYRYQFVRPLFPDLSATGGVARRILRTNEHRRRHRAKTHLCRRARKNA